MSHHASVVTLGCKANQFESAAMEQLLIDAGYQLISFDQGAELVVINTCTVTSATDSQSRKLVRRARRFNPECRIVVTGCYAQVQPEVLAELPGVLYVIGNMEKQQLLDILAGAGPKIQVGDIARQTSCPDLHIAAFSEHSRAFVQIQSGCNAFCSYCIIPFARGRSRSVVQQHVVVQVQDLVDAGYQEVVLTGIHIGHYGRDLTVALTLVDLLQALLQQTTIHRIRLGSIEPQELSSELIELVADSPRLCDHFHIPLQSGSDSVLKRMNRHYTGQQFEHRLQQIRQRLPDAAIGIDLICGFPGESDDEHRQTVAMVKRLPIHYLHVFPYSKRPGTAAASMPDHVSSLRAKQRAAELRALGEAKKKDFLQRFVGRNLEVVVERRGKEDRWRGISGEYIGVVVDSEHAEARQCLRVNVTDVCNDELVAVPLILDKK